MRRARGFGGRSGGLTLAVALAIAMATAGTAGCGVFAMEHDFEALQTHTKDLEKSLADATAAQADLRAQLEATRARLDNALRANADNGSDLMSSKARINDIAGRTDELTHNIEELRKDVAETRTELHGRIDELQRQPATTAASAPPPVAIPADRAAHWSATEAAFAKKDWATVRTLGKEYFNRYAADEHADDALYLVGQADLLDGRPSSALGEFNRVLKQFPRSNVLDKTLYAMGDAYLTMHDCTNAKLAFAACESRFAKEKIGADAKQQVAKIDKAAPGLCAPP